MPSISFKDGVIQRSHPETPSVAIQAVEYYNDRLFPREQGRVRVVKLANGNRDVFYPGGDINDQVSPENWARWVREGEMVPCDIL
jgi:hypothetical protein